MKTQVQLFALARERAGQSVIELDLPDEATVFNLRQKLGEVVPGLQQLIPHLLIAMGDDTVDDATPVIDGLPVACFPPVSGG